MPPRKKEILKGTPPPTGRGEGNPRGIYTTVAREARQRFADEAYWVTRKPSGWEAQGYTWTHAGGWEPREWGAASSDASGGQRRRLKWESEVVAALNAYENGRRAERELLEWHLRELLVLEWHCWNGTWLRVWTRYDPLACCAWCHRCRGAVQVRS